MNPKETIELMDNYYKINKTPEEMIRILMSPEISNICDDTQIYKALINYIRKLM